MQSNAEEPAPVVAQESQPPEAAAEPPPAEAAASPTDELSEAELAFAKLEEDRAQRLSTDLQVAQVAHTATEAGSLLQRAATVVPEGGALIALAAAPGGGRAFIVTARGGRANVRDVALPRFDPEQLDRLVNRREGWLHFYQGAEPSGQNRWRRWQEWQGAIAEAGHKLWPLLGEPLKDGLTAAGVQPGAPLIVLSDGPLTLLPLGLMRPPGQESAPRLMDLHPIAFAPSLPALVSAAGRARRPAVGTPVPAIVGDTTGSLAFARTEVALVERRFGEVARHDGGSVTPEIVTAMMLGRDYWHFAGPVLLSGNGARASGVQLGGRRQLTAGDLLEAPSLGGPRLAFLSACEATSFGGGRTAGNWNGLPAALLHLGAGGVVSSLWPSDSLATALLAARFYDLHRVDGLAPVQALQQAQIWLRDATRDSLKEYASQATQDQRMDKALAAGLLEKLREDPANRDSVRQIVALIKRQIAAPPPEAAVASGSERPFAHPYFWGGFILTGQ